MSNQINKSARLKAEYTNMLLDGRLMLPEQIVELVGSSYREQMEQMFQALWNRFLNNKSTTSTVYWYDKFNNDFIFNKFLKMLSLSGWATVSTLPSRNWSDIELNETKLLEFVSKEDLNNIRKLFKFDKYKMNKSISKKYDVTKLLGKKQNTGLSRPGFAKAGNSEFKYDTKYMEFYRAALELNLTKSMRELDLDGSFFEDGTDYMEVSKHIIDFHIENPNEIFTTGSNINDSRGRAISTALSKIFNPISSKDARSLLVLDDSRNFQDKHLEAVYLFIAELVGNKTTTQNLKALEGKRCYEQGVLHTLDLVTKIFKYDDNLTAKENKDIQKAENKRADADRKEIHENIWVERIYDELDRYNDFKSDIYSSNFKIRILSNKLAKFTKDTQWHKARYDNIKSQIEQAKSEIEIVGFNWSIPLEYDGTASVLQIEGALLDHNPFLEGTNCTGSTLSDIWTVKGVPRAWFKDIMTPTLYGSSLSPRKLWDSKGHKYTAEQLSRATHELNSGIFSTAKLFKDFIIKNVKPQETMVVKVWGEEFTIKCNRYKHKGDYKVRYNIYDSAAGKVKTIWHMHTQNVPDLEQFRRFFVTLIIHSLDSRVMDKVCQAINWIIPIHDAAIASPIDATEIREIYCSQIDAIHADRKTILSEYFYSIGIDSSATMDWKRVKDSIIPTNNFKCQPMALK